MELKKNLTAGALAALLALTGLACGGEEAADTDVDVEATAEDLATELDDVTETEMETEATPTETGAEATETEMEMEATETETEAEPTGTS